MVKEMERLRGFRYLGQCLMSTHDTTHINNRTGPRQKKFIRCQLATPPLSNHIRIFLISVKRAEASSGTSLISRIDGCSPRMHGLVS